MKRALLLLSLLFAGLNSFGQQSPVYGQYFHNPFLYNPGFAGEEMYPVLALTHKRQLMGIEGAPVASSLVFHTPILKSLAVGAKIYTESQGLLSSSSGQLALVYVLPVSGQNNLRFGLAGGLTSNQIDLSSVSPSQLEYLGDISSSFRQFDLGFGIVFSSPKGKLGLSFPNLTNKRLLSFTNYQPLEIQLLEHMVFTGSYKLDLLPSRLQLEPMLIYERFNSSQEQRIETGALLYLKELIWVGGTYQYKSGISGLLGVKVKDYVSFGYAYGMHNNITNGFQNASHELQLKIKLGKKRTFTEEPTFKPRFER